MVNIPPPRYRYLSIIFSMKMNVNATGVALASVFTVGALLYVIALNVGHM